MTRQELRAWRYAQGLPLPGLAFLLGVTPLTVQRWELGTRRVPAFLGLALKQLEWEFDHPVGTRVVVNPQG